MFVEASAPGKVILAGEHFVVHGGKALALAIRRYVRIRVSPTDFPLEIYHSESGKRDYVDSHGRWVSESRLKDLEPIEASVEAVFDYLGQRTNVRLDISSSIPMSAGLGSSASLAAAIVKGVSHYLGHELDRGELIEIASASERVVHGDPSGVDLSTVVSGGLVLFEGSFKRVVKNIRDVDLPLVVGDSSERRSTGVLVGNVGEISKKYGKIFSHLVQTSDMIVERELEAIINGELETLGGLFNVSQGLLYSIGVSTPKLERMVSRAIDLGALGAKLTGAGGGGCMIALTRAENSSAVVKALEDLGGESFFVQPDSVGVKSEAHF
ncbi:MAG: mevalonate kinase [Candidatus Geothermarchaeales archaeon]